LSFNKHSICQSQYSGVTGAHASEAARRARAPGRTDTLARAMGITCVEDLPDRDYTVWEVKEPATAKLPTWLPVRAEELPNPPAL